MGYINDFLYYTSGSECPTVFWRWSAISLLNHLLGRRCYYDHGGEGVFRFYPPVYIGLFGDAGSGKSTGMNEIVNILDNHFNLYMQSDSVQSREDMIQKIGMQECERVWNGGSYRPYFIKAAEMENLVSVDTRTMIALLVELFDTNKFSTGFKQAASSKFENPCISMLACGIPEWLMRELKNNLFTGGLGRRLILVVGEAGEPKPFPERPKDWREMKSKVISFLCQADTIHGVYKLTPAGRLWWESWYIPHKKNKPSDPILGSFHSTYHVMLLKVAMALAKDENIFNWDLSDVHLALAKRYLDELKPGIERLTSGVGRNVLAGLGVELIERLGKLGGAVKEKELYKMSRGNLNEREWNEVLRTLQTTDQIIVRDTENNAGMSIRIVFLPEAYEAYRKLQEQKLLPQVPT